MYCVVAVDEAGSRSITHWIVADLNTVEGRALLYSAIRQLVILFFFFFLFFCYTGSHSDLAPSSPCVSMYNHNPARDQH